MTGIYGEILTFPQQSGPDIRLRVFGSHDYSRYETISGFTVIYDHGLGQFCYAMESGEDLVSTGVSLDHSPPEGIVRHLSEPNRTVGNVVERLRRGESAEARSHHTVNRTFGPNQGLLNGRRLSIGTIRGLTILVNFSDVVSTTTAAHVAHMTNGPNYTLNGNASSVRDYFLTVSNGKLDYTNTVVGPYTLSQPRAFYMTQLLVEEALGLAVADGVDLSHFDSQGEGIVDALNILYAGQSVYQGNLWPHNSFLELTHGGVRTNLYLLTGLGRNPNELTIGTFCHENGHLLCRFPDMYDYGSRDDDDQDSAGIGRYCLMGSGNHLDFGRSPAPVCAYLRDLAGWCDNVIDLNTDGNYESIHGDYGTVMKYRSSKPNEYFVVENRTRQGLDRALPASGLAVYHCDIFGSNEYQQGSATRHYQCALLQADGRRDLENDARNQGDSEDLFAQVSGIALTSTTNPHTREWDMRDSGLILADISAPADMMSFTVGATSPTVTATGESMPNLAIPDNLAGGITDAIVIAASGVVERILVKVDIVHTYIGDLLIELSAPSGTRDVLHARQGGSQDDLLTIYDSDQPGELNAMIGQPMQGIWTLHVSDRAGLDTGTLVKWELTIVSTSLDRSADSQIAVSAPVPRGRPVRS
ncbi:MAG: M6 family metalloprotease domain-containing protein [Rhodothermales bacterium]|nr:M6 family metalloprotease domain-containing protein [Rhodothermales bacterium]